MDNLWYLVAAYTIVWAVVFGYILNLQRKQRQLHRELERLQRQLEERPAPD